jgi:hypothetical protein
MAVPATSLFTISEWNYLGDVARSDSPRAWGIQCRSGLSVIWLESRRQATQTRLRRRATRLVRGGSFNNNLTLEQPPSGEATRPYPPWDRRSES